MIPSPVIVALKNPKVIAAIVAAVALVAVVWYIYDEGGDARENKIVAEAINIERKVQDEKAVIRNNRPDRAGVIDSLRRGTF